MAKPSKYGKAWSQGITIAFLITLGFWVPVYLELEDKCINFWWCDFAESFVPVAALLSLAWLTCEISEYMEKRGTQIHKSKSGDAH